MKNNLLVLLFSVLLLPIMGQASELNSPQAKGSATSKSSTQSQNIEAILSKQDSIANLLNLQLTDIYNKLCEQQASDTYVLYPTENMFNFLKLNTLTGQIWQVQWALEGNNEGTVVLNSSNLGLSGSRFELYPTKNFYQFILLDKTYGRTWQVQWSLEEKNRGIIRIH